MALEDGRRSCSGGAAWHGLSCWSPTLDCSCGVSEQQRYPDICSDLEERRSCPPATRATAGAHGTSSQLHLPRRPATSRWSSACTAYTSSPSACWRSRSRQQRSAAVTVGHGGGYWWATPSRSFPR